MNGEFLLAFLVFGPFAAAALLAPFANKRERFRAWFTNVFLLAEFAALAATMIRCGGRLAQGGALAGRISQICGFGLSFRMDGFRLLYSAVAAFLWLIAAICCGEYFRGHDRVGRFYVFWLLTLGATMGVFLSQDLFTTYVFFEIMSLTSYTWVAQEESDEALRAAETYLAVAVIGGMVMLMGLFLVWQELGTLDFDGMQRAIRSGQAGPALRTAGICMLIGFGAKAGAAPLHIWLPKAHPAAPAPASALLSGILTKTGIFGILVLTTRLFSGDETWGILLLSLGALTMLGGAVLAIFSVNVKRVLACSSMSQIGFILIGAGMLALPGEQGMLAAQGTFLHMANHSLIKLVLFLSAGVIYQNTHSLDLTEIQGFGRKKFLLKGIFLVGALAISGIPLFGGYISKTLLHESILEYGGGGGFRLLEILFLCSGGLTLAYMMKLYLAIFVEKNVDSGLQEKYDQNRRYLGWASGAALTVSALVLFVWGVSAHGLMERAGALAQGFLGIAASGQDQAHLPAYFRWECLKGAAVTLAVGIPVYFLLIRWLQRDQKGRYRNLWPKWLDLEELLYRPLLTEVLPNVFGVLCRALDSAPDGLVVLLRRTIYADAAPPSEREEGNFVTEAAGRLLNFFHRMRRRLGKKTGEEERDYVHLCAMKYLEMKETGGIITRSLSFGLLLFGLGLCLTLMYILF